MEAVCVQYLLRHTWRAFISEKRVCKELLSNNNLGAIFWIAVTEEVKGFEYIRMYFGTFYQLNTSYDLSISCRWWLFAYPEQVGLLGILWGKDFWVSQLAVVDMLSWGSEYYVIYTSLSSQTKFKVWRTFRTNMRVLHFFWASMILIVIST